MPNAVLTPEEARLILDTWVVPETTAGRATKAALEASQPTPISAKRREDP